MGPSAGPSGPFWRVRLRRELERVVRGRVDGPFGVGKTVRLALIAPARRGEHERDTLKGPSYGERVRVTLAGEQHAEAVLDHLAARALRRR